MKRPQRQTDSETLGPVDGAATDSETLQLGQTVRPDTVVKPTEQPAAAMVMVRLFRKPLTTKGRLYQNAANSDDIRWLTGEYDHYTVVSYAIPYAVWDAAESYTIKEI